LLGDGPSCRDDPHEDILKRRRGTEEGGGSTRGSAGEDVQTQSRMDEEETGLAHKHTTGL